MSKFNIEEKIEAVIRYLQGTEGVKFIAKSIGVFCKKKVQKNARNNAEFCHPVI